MKKVKKPFLLQLADVDKMCSPRYTLTENTAVALPPSAAAANAETVEKKLSIYAKQVIFLRLELREKQKNYQWSLSSFWLICVHFCNAVNFAIYMSVFCEQKLYESPKVDICYAGLRQKGLYWRFNALPRNFFLKINLSRHLVLLSTRIIKTNLNILHKPKFNTLF